MKYTGSTFNPVLQNDRLLASFHDEHHGVYPGFPYISAGAVVILDVICMKSMKSKNIMDKNIMNMNITNIMNIIVYTRAFHSFLQV